jgi:hypothetical protein
MHLPRFTIRSLMLAIALEAEGLVLIYGLERLLTSPYHPLPCHA